MKQLISILLTVLSLTASAQTMQRNMDTSKPYTILVLMNATPQWLSLSRDERSGFFDKELNPILSKAAKTIDIRFFDSEYFNSSVSDFMIVNTQKLDDYKLLIERLRDTKIYSVPYFEIKDIVIGQENLFDDYNKFFKADQK